MHFSKSEGKETGGTSVKSIELIKDKATLGGFYKTGVALPLSMIHK